MPRFDYSAYDQNGLLKRGSLESSSRQAAIEALGRQGQLPIEVTEGGGANRKRWWEQEVFGDGSLSVPALTLFTHELASLVRADLPIDEALRIVSLQPLMSAKIRRVTRQVLDGVRQGNALSAALSSCGSDFPEYYWRLVQAGEASGSVGEVLEDLASFLERSSLVRGQIGSALLYPAFLLAGAAAALTLIMTVLLPALMPLFKDAGATPPATIRILAEVQAFLSKNWFVVPAGLVICIASVIAIGRNEVVRRKFDSIVLRLPIFGDIIANRETARFSRTLATLTRNGVPMLEAVRLAGSVLSNTAFKAAAIKAGGSLKEGHTLTAPLVESRLFSELSLRLIGVGEQSGQLEPMLMRVAKIYEETLQRQLTRVTSLITPLLTLVIGGIVGGLILSVMGAILSVNDLALK